MATLPPAPGPSEHHPSLDAILEELRPALRSGIAGLAETLLGPPNKAASSRGEWRWGNKGSFRIHVAGPNQGACADFESGWKGDPLAFIMREQRCDFTGAVKFGCDFCGIAFNGHGTPEDPTIRAAREAKHAQQKAEQEAKQEKDEGRRIARAGRLWEASAAMTGTVAETYLTVTRAILRPVQGWPDAVRYHAGSRSLIVAGTTEGGDVRFVQRIYLTPEGQKISAEEMTARGLLAVKQTDGVMAGAAVRFPGPAGGALILAEGPENALSLWSATEYETWASVGAIPKHRPPQGRRIVVGRDDDALTSPADKALKRAMAGWLDSGADVVLATPWPVRRQDKSDFNDVIKAGGPAAVRARVAAALEPPHKPVDRLTVEQARDDVLEAASNFYQDVRDYDARLRQAEAKAKADLTSKAPFAPEVVAARQAWTSARAASLEERRLARVRPATDQARAEANAARDAARAERDRAVIASEVASDFKRETRKIQTGIRAEAKAEGLRIAGPYPVHGLRVDVGAGKSRANLEAIVSLVRDLRPAKDKRVVGVAIPAHSLGDQQAERLDKITKHTGISAAVWRSRKAPDPNHPDYLDSTKDRDRKTKMCCDLDAVDDADEALADVQTSACRKVDLPRKSGGSFAHAVTVIS